jgi:carotenoid cleavage dioxygenase-like enzyme
MSFFAKYDEDEALADLEKVTSNERTPLLASMKPPHVDDETALSQAPPISSDDEEQCRLYYYRFSLTSPIPEITHQFALSTIPFEFPTVNPAYEMSAARYIYGCSTSNESFGAALGKATKIDVLVKADVQALLAQSEQARPKSVTGSVDTRSISSILSEDRKENDPLCAFQMPPNWYAQEARFVSRHNPVSEDDGYLLFYAFDESQIDGNGECSEDAKGELWVLDARNMRDVVCKVRLPQRVPYGLHGNWFTEGMIGGQRGVEKIREMPVQSDGGKWLTKMKSGVIGALG